MIFFQSKRAFFCILVLTISSLLSCGGGGGSGSNKTTVTGTVVDSRGLEVSGATVQIKDMPLSTSTDFEGFFSIEVDAGDHFLSVLKEDYLVSQKSFSVQDESLVDLGVLVPTNLYYVGGVAWYKDLDGDLFSDGISIDNETPIPGYDIAGNLSDTSGDCDDSDGSINPGAAEKCNGTDDDCDTAVDEDFMGLGDSCLAGVGECESFGSYVCAPDGEGVVCDAAPGTPADELCDGLDNDCDGLTDEGVTTTCYQDNDHDGYGSDAHAEEACSVPDGFVLDNSDCDDSNYWINPDSIWFKDADDDGYSDFSILGPQCDRPYSYSLEMELASLSDSDCDDSDSGTHPGAIDIPDDGVDQDCDGSDATASGVNEALVPAGCFEMGDAIDEGNPDELPVHTVCLSRFYMDVHEVTNARYKECVDAGVCPGPSDYSSETRAAYFGNTVYEDFPVIYVDWYKADAFCAWKGKRLPTEAEWEYAARGGLSGKPFPSGDWIDGTEANYWDSGDPWDNDTAPVGYHTPNGYGLYDMAGNVYEWTSDWYSDTYYSESPVDDPQGPETGTMSTLRGGSWDDPPFHIRVTERHPDPRSMTYWNVGFRCASD